VNKKFFAADRELWQGKISGSRTQAEGRTSKSDHELRQKGKNNCELRILDCELAGKQKCPFLFVTGQKRKLAQRREE